VSTRACPCPARAENDHDGVGREALHRRRDDADDELPESECAYDSRQYASTPGAQYIVLSKSRVASEGQFLVPYRLIVKVIGKAGTGAPDYLAAATPTPNATPSPSATAVSSPTRRSRRPPAGVPGCSPARWSRSPWPRSCSGRAAQWPPSPSGVAARRRGGRRKRSPKDAKSTTRGRKRGHMASLGVD